MGKRAATITGHHGDNPWHDSKTGRFTSPGIGGVPVRIPAHEIRSRIAQIASASVGMTDWEKDAQARVPGSFETFQPGQYKCNLFVYSVLYQAD